MKALVLDGEARVIAVRGGFKEMPHASLDPVRQAGKEQPMVVGSIARCLTALKAELEDDRRASLLEQVPCLFETITITNFASHERGHVLACADGAARQLASGPSEKLPRR